ncbi:hypothetical protein NX773_15115 [Massilia solisilvae]|uniref:Pilus assembly protein n=1 Tax=Massilia solisilvae TaxID=1811225 RepID=A0ABT2BLW7_9BURK|nr:hypothetical protein [Massilia solisilvae]MCS0609499.1 hypothetical protein [Massilia solisilvae]
MKPTAYFLFIGMLAGCSATPQYDARFGDAVRQARMAQVLNPDAGRNPDQALGIGTQPAIEAQKRYQDSFKAPPPVTNVINIGGAVNGGSTK